MATIRMREAEATRGLHSLLAQGQEGLEIMIEREKLPVAVLRASKLVGRMIWAMIADFKYSAMESASLRPIMAIVREFQMDRRSGGRAAQGINLPLGDLVIGACALELDCAIATAKRVRNTCIAGLRVQHSATADARTLRGMLCWARDDSFLRYSRRQ